MLTRAQIQERAADISAIAIENGWDPPTWGNFLAKIALIWTEVVEADDQPNAEKKLEEWADVTIRILDVLHTLPASSSPIGELYRHGCSLDLHRDTSRKLAFAVELYRLGSDNEALAVLWDAVTKIDAHVAYHDRDLWGAVDRKIAFNRTRPPLHGKKRSVG